MRKRSPRILAFVAALALVGACSSSSDSREGLTDALVDAGFSRASAQCVLDSLDTQGVDVDGLRPRDVSSPSPEMMDSFGQAGADCVDDVAGDIGNLDSDLFDLSNPAAYDQFVKQMSAESGLPTQDAECVADYFIDNDVNAADLLTPDPEIEAVLLDALEACDIELDF